MIAKLRLHAFKRGYFDVRNYRKSKLSRGIAIRYLFATTLRRYLLFVGRVRRQTRLRNPFNSISYYGLHAKSERRSVSFYTPKIIATVIKMDNQIQDE